MYGTIDEGALSGSPNIIMSWLIFVDGDDGPEHCFNPRLMMFVLIAGADISRSASGHGTTCWQCR